MHPASQDVGTFFRAVTHRVHEEVPTEDCQRSSAVGCARHGQYDLARRMFDESGQPAGTELIAKLKTPRPAFAQLMSPALMTAEGDRRSAGSRAKVPGMLPTAYSTAAARLKTLGAAKK